MEVSKRIVKKNKIAIDLELDLSDIPRDERDLAKESVGEVIVAEIINDLHEGISSVNGKKFTKLSPEYRKKKLELFGTGVANLIGTESMSEAIQFEVLRGNKIRIYIDEDETAKAFNHNVGDTLPQRKFLPVEDGDSFRKQIRDEVKLTLDDYRAD